MSEIISHKNISKQISIFILGMSILNLIVIPMKVMANNSSASENTIKMQELNYSGLSKIHAKVSAGLLNRIELENIGISQIIGDESQYKYLIDKRANNIFIIPKLPAGNIIELSLISQTGEVFDMRLLIEETEGQFIKILRKSLQKNEVMSALQNFEISEPYSFRSTNILSEDELEITKMIKAMQRNEKDKYYVTAFKRKILKQISTGITLNQECIYRYKNLTGTRLSIVNNSSKKSFIPVTSDFSELFEGTLAVSLSSASLAPKEKGELYIVTKEAVQ